MGFFSDFSVFLASFKILFSSLHNPNYLSLFSFPSNHVAWLATNVFGTNSLPLLSEPCVSFLLTRASKLDYHAICVQHAKRLEIYSNCLSSPNAKKTVCAHNCRNVYTFLFEPESIVSLFKRCLYCTCATPIFTFYFTFRVCVLFELEIAS